MQDIWIHIKQYLTVECGIVLLGSCVIIIIISYLCYDSIFVGMAGLPLSLVILRLYFRMKDERKQQETLLEFKDMLYALESGLKVGYSLENAWINAEEDLRMLYPKESFFQKEVHTVTMQLRVNVPIEMAVQTLANHCRLEEINSFSDVLATAKRSGGNIVQMMEKITTVIAEKIDVEQEIQTMLSGKKMEQRIMCGMPLFMLAYLRMTNAEYIAGLYHNAAGNIVMTICLIGTIVAAFWGNKIVGIEV